MATIYFKEGFAPVISYDDTVDGILKKLAKEIETAANPKWTVHFPASVDDVMNLLVLKYTLGTGTTKDVYIEFFQPRKVQTVVGEVITDTPNRENYYYMECVQGTGVYTAPTMVDGEGYYTDKGEWEEDKASVRSRFSWFKNDTLTTIKKWLPIQYWISLTDERLTLVLKGDPSANKLDAMMGFGYFGQVKPFKNSKERPLSNFGMSVSSDIPPGTYLNTEEENRYSDQTGTGVTDLVMLETYTGFPMQAHMPAFTTPDEFVNKQLDGPSAYTDKYHMSPVYVFHGFDGYRGELYGLVATDRSTVVNKDDLIHKYNATTGQEDNPDTQDIYKVFLVNAPYCLLNNGTNVMYGLAVLKSTEPYVAP